MCRRKCARTRTSMREKLAQVRAHTATSNVEHVCKLKGLFITYRSARANKDYHCIFGLQTAPDPDG